MGILAQRPKKYALFFRNVKEIYVFLMSHIYCRPFCNPAQPLIDESNKPILDNIDSRDMAKEARDSLRDLYSSIKSNDAHIRFAFLTGVSKFSKVSIFSGINNIEDITLTLNFPPSAVIPKKIWTRFLPITCKGRIWSRSGFGTPATTSWGKMYTIRLIFYFF